MNNDLEQFSEERLREIADFAMAGAIEVVELARIALSVKQAKPDYYIVRLELNDVWGVEAELNAYESQLDASKCKDDHGGVIIPCYTTPQPAHTEQVIPDGWKLVPVTPTDKMLLNAMIAGEIDSILPAISRAESIWEQFLAAAPKPESE